jgi:hypothetical protein
MGADSLKSAPETEFLVPRAKHIAPFDVTTHQVQSTHESLLAVEGTPPYSHFEGNLTDKNRASHPVACRERAQKHLLTDKKIFTIGEQYNCQNDKIYAQTSCEVKEKVPRVQRGHHPSYIMVLSGCPIRGLHLFIL